MAGRRDDVRAGVVRCCGERRGGARHRSQSGREPGGGAAAEQGGGGAPAARGRDLRRRLQRALPPPQLRRVGDRDGLRHGRRDRRARRRGLRARRHDRGPQLVARPPARAPGRRARGAARGRRRARRSRRHAAGARGRDRRPAGRLLRELRRPLPVRRGQGPRRRLDARHRDLRRPDPLAVVEPRGGHPDRFTAARDEREHRPGHDARHLHRASRAAPDRRRGNLDAAAADPDPHRLEHGRDDRGAGQHVARRRPAADELALPEGLHDALHGPDRGLRALPRAGDASSRTSRSWSRCRTRPTATSAAHRR